MLYPAGPGKVLREFLVSTGNDLSRSVITEDARARGALINRNDEVFGHDGFVRCFQPSGKQNPGTQGPPFLTCPLAVPEKHKRMPQQALTPLAEPHHPVHWSVIVLLMVSYTALGVFLTILVYKVFARAGHPGWTA